MAYKKRLLIDFDAVLHRYTGWKGPDQFDEPLPMARKAMHLLHEEGGFELVCFTTRDSEGVEKWLRRHGFPPMRVTSIKEPAFLQIDDRAILFEGEWTDDLLKRIRDFHPYWEKQG